MISLLSFFHSLPIRVQGVLLTPLKVPLLRQFIYSFLLRRHTDDGVRSVLLQHRPIKTVIHVGAHKGQEAWFYEALGASNVTWIEADPEIYPLLLEHLKPFQRRGSRQTAISACLSDVSGREVTLVRYSNSGASNSIVPETPLFAKMWPGIRPTGETVHLVTHTLRDVCRLSIRDARSLLVIDVQGHELEVLKGAGIHLLEAVDIIQVEVSVNPIYEGASYSEVEKFLNVSGFNRISAHADDHGDVVFARSSPIDSAPPGIGP